jgi:hypothetical protein
MAELQALRQAATQCLRDAEGILRRLAEIERFLKILEPPVMPKLNRRQPVS